MNWQKIILLDVNAETLVTIQGYLAQGYVLHQMLYLPGVNKILIVYYDPAQNPQG